MVSLTGFNSFNRNPYYNQSSGTAFGANSPIRPDIDKEVLERLAAGMVAAGYKTSRGNQKVPLFKGENAQKEAEQLAALIVKNNKLPHQTTIIHYGRESVLESFYDEARVCLKTHSDRLPQSIRSHCKYMGGRIVIFPKPRGLSLVRK